MGHDALSAGHGRLVFLGLEEIGHPGIACIRLAKGRAYQNALSQRRYGTAELVSQIRLRILKSVE